MKNTLIKTLGLILGVTLPSCSSKAQAPPSDEQIGAMLRQAVETRRLATGMAGAVVDANGARFFAAGKTDSPGGEKVTADTVFEIGSVTKTFTALLLADMSLRGEVGLDDPIAKYLPPGVSAPERDGKQITLRVLAEQCSGLPRMPDNFAPANGENPYVDYDAKRMFDFLSGYKLPRGIGEKYEYSNFGFGLLGTLLARRAGTNYEGLVRARICEPLGMKDTVLTLTPELRARVAAPHDGKLKRVSMWDFDAFAGAGGIRSTARDMAKYVAANLGLTETRLKAAIDLTHEPTAVEASSTTHMGLGWHISDRGGTRIVWHNGETGGYHSFVGLNLKAKVGVVLLANSANGIEDIGYKIVDNAPVTRTAIALPVAALEAVVGQYELAPGASFSIKREGNQVFARLTGQSYYEIFPQSETEFFYKVVDAQLTFVKDKDGKVTSLILHQNGLDQPARKVSGGE